MSEAAAAPTRMQRLLDAVERFGNRVPHPVVIFVILAGIVIVLSHIAWMFGAHVTLERWNATTHEIDTVTVAARSLLTVDGIRFMYTGVVSNFMSFNAVGVIIVAMVGVGVAEEAGLIKALIRKLVAISPAWALSYILTFVGILSSVAADAGYLVLIPLAAAAYLSVGRHPLAGLAVGFASVAAAFLVNILIVPTDGILTEITNDAIRLIDPGRTISLTANKWFSLGSVALLVVLIGLVTEKVVEPRLGPYHGEYTLADQETGSPEAEARGLRFALYGLVGVIVFILLMLLPPGAPLRNPETGSMIVDSAFMGSLIVTIAMLFATLGIAYGIGAGTMNTPTQVVNAMAKAIGSLSGLILLLLVIAQFLAYFNYSNLSTVAAISMSDVLQRANLDAIWLLIGFVIVTMLLDLLITGAIPKWAMFAPVFVPLLMKLDVSPEAVLAAYRVGDSPMNAITPLNAYFAMIVTFAERYQKGAGVGTVIALMLPYIVVLAVVWTAFLAAWQLLGLPWGF